MAYKVFSNGDALTGGELNTYLMNQAVISFATTTARDAAIPAPSEGQLVWLEDSNKYVYYTGSAWTDLITPASSGNAIINGAFDIWQRGTSLTVGNAGVSASTTADRWASYRSANTTAITVTKGTGSGVIGAPNYARLQRTASNTSTEPITFGQTIEIANASLLTGQTLTFSYYARKGANYSAASSNFTARWKTGTGSTDQNGIYNVYTGETNSSSTSVLTTDFQRFTHSFTATAGITQLAISFEIIPVGTAGAADYVDLTGVQLEVSSVATSFKRNANSLQGELAACQRYYYRMNSSENGYQQFTYQQGAANTVDLYVPLVPKTTMRVKPTAIDYANISTNDGTFRALTALIIDGGSQEFVTLKATVASGLTANKLTQLQANNTLNAYIGLSAEL